MEQTAVLVFRTKPNIWEETGNSCSELMGILTDLKTVQALI